MRFSKDEGSSPPKDFDSILCWLPRMLLVTAPLDELPLLAARPSSRGKKAAGAAFNVVVE